MARDPWDVLGVAKTATDDEIKRAYKKQAMQHHPDRGGNEEKFKECTLAYNSIKDAQSRAQYQQEQMGGRGFRDMNHSYDFHGTPFGGMHVDLNDLFAQAFGGQNPFSFGQGFQGHQEPRFSNRDINIRYTITLRESHQGANKQIRVKMPDGNYRSIDITIPKGVDTGHKIRYNALGEQRYTNAPPGDLYVNITVQGDPMFRKLDEHLETKINVDAIDAMLGCEQVVETFDGGRLSMKIHPGTQSGTRMRIPEHGTYTLDNNRRGDLLVELIVKTPKFDSKEDLIKAINNKVNK